MMEGMFSGGTHLPDVASWARQWPGDRAARDRGDPADAAGDLAWRDHGPDRRQRAGDRRAVTNLTRDWARAVVDVPVPTAVHVNRVSDPLSVIGQEATLVRYVRSRPPSPTTAGVTPATEQPSTSPGPVPTRSLRRVSERYRQPAGRGPCRRRRLGERLISRLRSHGAARPLAPDRCCHDWTAGSREQRRTAPGTS